MQSHYFDRIKKHVVSEFGAIERLTIELRQQGRNPKPARRSGTRRAGAARGEPRLCSDAGFGAQARAGTRSWLDPARLRQILPARRMRRLRRLAAGSSTFLRDFLVGPSNHLAYAAACRIAEPRAIDVPPMYNPLYVPCGGWPRQDASFTSDGPSGSRKYAACRLSDRGEIHDQLRLVVERAKHRSPSRRISARSTC